jgi:hypothetical protein
MIFRKFQENRSARPPKPEPESIGARPGQNGGRRKNG